MRKLLILILMFTAVLARAQTTAGYSGVEATTTFYLEDDRTYVFQELNEFRANPADYGRQYGLDLSIYYPRDPYVQDPALNQYAQRYAEYLYSKAPWFGHSGWDWHESICWNYDVKNSVSQFVIDKGVPDLGHRKHLLMREHTKVGIGIYKGWVGKRYRVYTVILTE